MSDLSNQKRLAANVLGTGVNRIWIDPEKLSDVANAITREDIRGLIKDGTVKSKQPQGISRIRVRRTDVKRKKGHKTGHGSRKGAKHARTPKKALWMRKIRAQRKALRSLRNEQGLDRNTYRRMYRKAKGGEYRTVGILTAQAEHALASRREE